MKVQKTLLLIFNKQGACLGEMFFDHDRFTEAYLHPEGDPVLGDWLLDWQVTGITHCQKFCSGKNHVCAVGEHISMRSPEFPAALRAWLERHGLYSLPLPESAWQAWNIIQQLPLLPSESYKLAQALADSDYQDKDRLTASLKALFQELESLQKSPAKTPTKRSSFRIGREKSPTLKTKQSKPSVSTKPAKLAKLSKRSSFRIGREKSPPLSPKASKPVKPVKSTKSTKPVKKTGAKKPTKLAKSSKHSSFRIGREKSPPLSPKASKPVKPVKSTKSTKPVKKTGAKKPTKLAKSSKHSSFRIGREKSPLASATSRKPVKKTTAKKPVKLSKPPKTPKQSKRKKPTKR